MCLLCFCFFPHVIRTSLAVVSLCLTVWIVAIPLTADNCSEELVAAIEWADAQEEYASPFDMDGFIDSYFAEALAMLDESTALLEQGKLDNVHGDSFGLATVIYSVVLLMLGIVGTFKRLPNRFIILGVAIAGFLFATIYMFTLPLPTGFNFLGYF